MEIDQRLNEQLLSQDFRHNDAEGMDKYLSLAKAYAVTENAIAVVSNLQVNISHIYYGGMGERLGIAERGDNHVLNSIWEEEIFCHIHPDDFVRKQLGELHFYQFIKEKAPSAASDYMFVSGLRMSDAAGRWHSVQHVSDISCPTNGRYGWRCVCILLLLLYPQKTAFSIRLMVLPCPSRWSPCIRFSAAGSKMCFVSSVRDCPAK